MKTKERVTVTIDKDLFDSFKKVLPDYISISGVFETLVKEYMAGYYRCAWSISEMIDVLRGKMTADYLQRVYDLGLKGLPQREIDETLSDEEFFSREIGERSSKEKSRDKQAKRRKGV